jgi:NADPH:quinone reductase-like Zn-dependent oxidoreductase
MLAAVAARVAPADPLSGLEVREHPDPAPPPGWELVQVRAAALNHHDVFTLRGIATDAANLPIVLGSDAAGVTPDGREVVVHAVVGDTLLSEVHDGTQAGLVAVPSASLLDKPPELSFAEAACLPTAWLTAYSMLFGAAALRPGQRVLVQGAGGGVATAALLLGHAAGLAVYVTSRDQVKRERARKLGAAAVLAPGERTPERVDAVIETVGEATWAHSLRALRPGGVLVTAGATSGPNPPAELNRVFARRLRIVGTTMGTRDELRDLLRMLVETGVRPVIDSQRPLADAPAAYQRMVAGDVFGKLVLTPYS